MKEQMAEMMGALNLIKSKLESSNSFTEGGVSSYLRVPHQDEVQAQNVNTQENTGAQVFPQYGLPTGYVPPTAE